jgi:hypothetical protein
MAVSIGNVPEPARGAWHRLTADLQRILGDELVAMWAYGGSITTPPDAPQGDLDTFVVVRRPLGSEAARAIEEAQARIADDTGVEWDAWYVTEEEASRPEMLRHAWRDRLNESWAIDRAHWLGGRYVLLHGVEPEEIVPVPSREELDEALRAEVDHLERHVEAGDTDPYEATYAFLNGSRVVRAIETGDVVMSKREAGPWGLEHLPDRWRPALEAAIRAYDKRSTPEDEDLLAREMAPFVGMVRERIS